MSNTNAFSHDTPNMICTKPMHWLEISSERTPLVHLCCSGWLKKPIGNLNPDGNGIADLWNNNKARLIRKSVIDGSFSYCDKELCPYLANPLMIHVDSESPIRFVSDIHKKQMLKLNDEGKLGCEPTVFNAAYDRSCNLACPSCRVSIFHEPRERAPQLTRIYREVIETFKSSLRTLYLSGSGDPLGSAHFLSILREDIGYKYPRLRLKLHTNAVLFNEKRWKLISHNEKIIEQIEVSVDGLSRNTFEANRFPARWEQFIKGIEFISNLKKRGMLFKFKLNFVVQENNWREISMLSNFAKYWSVDVVKISALGDWGTFSSLDYHARAVHKRGHANFNNFMTAISNIEKTDIEVIHDFSTSKLYNDPDQMRIKWVK